MTRFFCPSVHTSELTLESNASSSKTIRDNLTIFCMQVKRSILSKLIKMTFALFIRSEAPI